MVKNNNNNQEEPLEKQLWKATDKLRKNIYAAEYKHKVLSLIFLKFISDAFKKMYNKLQQGEGDYVAVDPEDRDEYKMFNPILSKIKTNQQQIRTLKKLWDTLLSKLICGELNVEMED